LTLHIFTISRYHFHFSFARFQGSAYRAWNILRNSTDESIAITITDRLNCRARASSCRLTRIKGSKKSRVH
jgi:hypothetical protein